MDDFEVVTTTFSPGAVRQRARNVRGAQDTPNWSHHLLERERTRTFNAGSVSIGSSVSRERTLSCDAGMLQMVRHFYAEKFAQAKAMADKELHAFLQSVEDMLTEGQLAQSAADNPRKRHMIEILMSLKETALSVTKAQPADLIKGGNVKKTLRGTYELIWQTKEAHLVDTKVRGLCSKLLWILSRCGRMAEFVVS